MLLEREAELQAIDKALAAACAGRGGVLAVEAPAGLGKTRLLDAARDRAASLDMRTLAARGFELEREFTFGVLRQLYEPVAPTPDERDRLLRPTSTSDPVFGVAHAAFWLTTDLAAERPVLIAVDDAHWADAASLRCLVYLARRIGDLPALLVAAARPGEPGAPDDLLRELAGTSPLEPAPLSRSATRDLIAAQMEQPVADAFAAAAHEMTGGNPFLAVALAKGLSDEGVRPDEAGARILPTVTPSAVARSVLVRLARLGSAAMSLAQAVAVLGDGASLPHAAALARLEERTAADAADELVRADVLRAGAPLAFSHPLVREAVHAESPAHNRAALHAEAARLLDGSGASVERVGAQLLRTHPSADAWTAERLIAAGESARARGALDSATAFLRRALEEPPPHGERPRLLHLLGGVEVRAGDAAGYEHLDEAAELAEDPALRAAIGFDRARGLLLAGRPEAVEALERASAELPPGERDETLLKEAELVVLGRMTPDTAPLVMRRADALAADANGDGLGAAAVLGVMAGNAYLRNEPAARVADLARRSLEARRAAGEDPAESAGFLNAAYLLSLAGGYAEAEAHLSHAIDRARAANALIVFAAAASFRARAALQRGALDQAEADAAMALDAADVSIAPLPLPATVGVLIEAFVERAALDEADALLRDRGFAGDLPPLGPFNDLAFARGRLRLAQGRPGDALAELTSAGRSAQALCIRAPGPFPWRPWAAVALRDLGRREEAGEMAEEAVTVARRFGAPRDLGAALRSAGDRGSLDEAVEVLTASEAALELARARTELGSLLRRSGPREPAREILRAALDGATACGATALAERARSELLATGARPRRPRVSGLAALTASERRVAELAADGLTNRQIAEGLFVTAKTVEKHLAGAYAKLEIAGRAELGAALGEAKDGGGAPYR